MNRDLVLKDKLNNMMQTVMVLLIMAGVTSLLAYMTMGFTGLVIVVFAGVIPLVADTRLSLRRAMNARQVTPLSPAAFPKLNSIVATLVQNAGLSSSPRLYFEPSRMMNAYAMGDRQHSIIVLTEALLRNLNLRELTTILGHEVAHIRNNDLQVMALADGVQRMTRYISIIGQLMLLSALPFILSGNIRISPVPLLFLLIAPTLCHLLLLALSRTREFQADLVSVELTGDPNGLACALKKLEDYHRTLWQRLLRAPWSQQSTWLQTHPPTYQRIQRILSIAGSPSAQEALRYRFNTSYPLRYTR